MTPRRTGVVPGTVVVLLLGVAAQAAPVPKEIKAKPASLDGKWEIVELKSGTLDVTHLNPWVWDISGEKLTIYNRENDALRPNDLRTTTTLVRPSGGGVEDVDYIRDDGKAPMTFKGLVSVTETEMILCFSDPNQPRPAERKSGQRVSYYRFKRVSDK